jgi:hypothetical protein
LQKIVFENILEYVVNYNPIKYNQSNLNIKNDKFKNQIENKKLKMIEIFNS